MNNPTATKEAITSDGWYKTGDVCTRDPEGFYHVVDRIKELIKYKVRVSPVVFDNPSFLTPTFFRLGFPRYYHAFRESERADSNPPPFSFLVAPAEIEALLLQHPKILDAAVIGVYSEEEVTELPRSAFPCYHLKLKSMCICTLTPLSFLLFV